MAAVLLIFLRRLTWCEHKNSCYIIGLAAAGYAGPVPMLVFVLGNLLGDVTRPIGILQSGQLNEIESGCNSLHHCRYWVKE